MATITIERDNQQVKLARNAGPHVALRVLARQAALSQEHLIDVVGQYALTDSAAKRQTTIALQRLRDLAAVERTQTGHWSITPAGVEILKKLEGKPKSSAPTVQVVPPRNINLMAGNYDGAELRDNCKRAGAFDFRKYPSRIGNTLVYRDGRTEPAK